eukprot:sb/3469152/
MLQTDCRDFSPQRCTLLSCRKFPYSLTKCLTLYVIKTSIPRILVELLNSQQKDSLKGFQMEYSLKLLNLTCSKQTKEWKRCFEYNGTRFYCTASYRLRQKNVLGFGGINGLWWRAVTCWYRRHLTLCGRPSRALARGYFVTNVTWQAYSIRQINNLTKISDLLLKINFFDRNEHCHSFQKKIVFGPKLNQLWMTMLIGHEICSSLINVLSPRITSPCIGTHTPLAAVIRDSSAPWPD